jgi:hypothetical protein
MKGKRNRTTFLGLKFFIILPDDCCASGTCCSYVHSGYSQ